MHNTDIIVTLGDRDLADLQVLDFNTHITYRPTSGKISCVMANPASDMLDYSTLSAIKEIVADIHRHSHLIN